MLSFLVDGVEALDRAVCSIARASPCAPDTTARSTMQRFGLTGTVRASLALYNTHGEVEHLACVPRRPMRA